MYKCNFNSCWKWSQFLCFLIVLHFIDSQGKICIAYKKQINRIISILLSVDIFFLFLYVSFYLSVNNNICLWSSIYCILDCLYLSDVDQFFWSFWNVLFLLAVIWSYILIMVSLLFSTLFWEPVFDFFFSIEQLL